MDDKKSENDKLRKQIQYLTGESSCLHYLFCFSLYMCYVCFICPLSIGNLKIVENMIVRPKTNFTKGIETTNKEDIEYNT